MADPVSVGVGVLLGALNDRLKTLVKRLSSSAVSIGLALLLGATIQLDWGHVNQLRDISTDPVAAAYQVAHVFGLADMSWIDAVANWLARPAIVPAAWIAAAAAGLYPLRWRVHGVEIAWLVLLPASVVLGVAAYWTALISLAIALSVVAARGAVDLWSSHDWYERRRWYHPEHVPVRFFETILNFIFTPVMPAIRMIMGIADNFTFEPKLREPATGARVIGLDSIRPDGNEVA
ncbi:hypothetical protein [Rathayibacter rathayi]|uniref:hypothetical protein n=1 Tax=Rathayibacter rathayi TaxID=33887 RepID=UPI000BC89909|nr:hypothetical protein [Rathayibacter rathayi]MWV74156.1 hypothetical protein [Rathayibacter rathayi NCPPB 2980 = VKM Ac-1601]PPF24003.1 hypothetical protein C5C34_06480 [Rathayibacter rathayi]PPG68497.1 hypothetical protein C5C16_07370 [Rathayibacter rathayi]PPG78798.1 hypothetical protein C5C15_07440 [Rathayibacter rathayi]PPG95027.1 hypothetical protein C5C22_06845 [Rathayibacter rathayi]